MTVIIVVITVTIVELRNHRKVDPVVKASMKFMSVKPCGNKLCEFVLRMSFGVNAKKNIQIKGISQMRTIRIIRQW